MPSCIDSYNMSSDGFTQHFVTNLGHLYEMRENEGDSTVYLHVFDACDMYLVVAMCMGF